MYNNERNGVYELKITSRFTVAVHTLLAIYTFQDKYKVTSDFIASSVNVNPVVIRRTLQNLKAAKLVDIKAGIGGATLAKNAADITLYDVYSVVDCINENLFNFHDNPNPDCPVGKNIHSVLDKHLTAAQTAMENELKNVTIEDLSNQLKICTNND